MHDTSPQNHIPRYIDTAISPPRCCGHAHKTFRCALHPQHYRCGPAPLISWLHGACMYARVSRSLHVMPAVAFPAACGTFTAAMRELQGYRSRRISNSPRSAPVRWMRVSPLPHNRPKIGLVPAPPLSQASVSFPPTTPTPAMTSVFSAANKQSTVYRKMHGLT